MAGTEPRAYSDFVSAIAGVLEGLGIDYAVTGSLASGLYGEPRTTLDVDLTLRLSDAKIAAFAQSMQEAAFAVDDLAVRDRLQQTRPQPFNIVDTSGGWKADCYPLRASSYDQTAFERRREIHFPDAPRRLLWVLAPEDVILNKLVFYRRSDGISAKHLRDIAGMLINIQATNAPLDLAYVERWASVLQVADLWKDVSQGYRGGSTSEPE